MIHEITCDQFSDALADLLERDVSESTRAVMESHALTCGACGSLLADLRKLRIDAASLPEFAPSRDLWTGITARIGAPVVPIAAGRAMPDARGSTWKRWAARSAAAAALVGITAGVTYYTTMRLMSARAPDGIAGVMADMPAALHIPSARQLTSDSTVESAPVSVPPTETGTGSPARSRMTARLVTDAPRAARSPAEATYDIEITRLHAILTQRRAQLDPSTIGVIERNLQIIDGAIAQCRSALARDPASRYLMQSLDSALENKVELLRTAATLPSRS